MQSSLYHLFHGFHPLDQLDFTKYDPGIPGIRLPVISGIPWVRSLDLMSVTHSLGEVVET